MVVVDHDLAWRDRFDVVARALHDALGDLALRVDHFGSTAVPGLAAKPVIDVQVSVRQLRPLDPYRDAIESVGYLHRPHPEVPDREFFRPPGRRTVHVHVVARGSRNERQHLLTRDFLRTHEVIACRYALLKRALAEEFRDSRQDYQAGKESFLEELIVEAEAWAVETGWAP